MKPLAGVLCIVRHTGCVYVEDEFVNVLADDGVQVDRLKTNMNLSTAGPYYLAVNLTDLTVSVLVIYIMR